MLNRSIIIITCICMLGVTVVPAAAIPCCCKSAAPCAKHSSGKPTGVMASCCSQMPVKAKSCCEKPAMKSCCAGKTVKAPCGVCRCLEQLQVLALTGYVVYDSTMRTASSAIIEASPELVCQSPAISSPLETPTPHSLQINLQTCNLRC
jgi:hypothetical protein